MTHYNRRHILFGLSTWGLSGCHLIRFENDEKDQAPTVAETLRATKSDLKLLDGPRRVGMKVATIIAPFKDVAIDSSIWHTADEQVVPTELRDLLRKNGLRIGVLRSALPSEIEELMRRSGPAGQAVEPLIVNQPINEPVKIAVTDSKPEATIQLAATEQSSEKKSYKDISGFIRASAMTDNQSGVIMRITPELHHGEIKSYFKPTSDNQNAFEPAQLSLRNGQTEDLIKELVTNIRVEEGQCLVIGADTEKEGTLGWFLLTEQPTSNLEMRQKMILIWAWKTSRDASFKVPAIVQTNSQDKKEFSPLKSPAEASVADGTRKNDEKTRDSDVQTAGFTESSKKAKTGEKSAKNQPSPPKP